MSTMLKVIEVFAESDKSLKDATNNAISLARNSVKNIKSISIYNHETNVEDGEIIYHRINAKVSFLLNLN